MAMSGWFSPYGLWVLLPSTARCLCDEPPGQGQAGTGALCKMQTRLLLLLHTNRAHMCVALSPLLGTQLHAAGAQRCVQGRASRMQDGQQCKSVWPSDSEGAGQLLLDTCEGVTVAIWVIAWASLQCNLLHSQNILCSSLPADSTFCCCCRSMGIVNHTAAAAQCAC